MIRSTFLTLTLFSVVFAGAVSADTINLRNGESIQGSFLGATSRQVRFDVNGNVRTFDIDRIQSIAFEDQGAPPPPPYNSGAADPGYRRDRNGYSAQEPPPPPPPAYGVIVPVDTRITIRMIDSVNSKTAQLGQTFRASVDEPVFVDGREAISRGADVTAKLVEDRQSGKFEGRTVLTLALVSITVNGREFAVQSSDVRTESASRGARSAETVGGGTALGDIVGALAGGGKGAAIGAASGATLGAGVEVFTQGQVVKIPSETRLSFRLQTPIQL